jgi:hypothetical protein
MKQNVIAYCKFNNFYQFNELNTDGQQAFSKPILENCWIHFLFSPTDETSCLIAFGTETEIDKFSSHVMSLKKILPGDETIEGAMKDIAQAVGMALALYFEDRLNLKSMFCD